MAMTSATIYIKRSSKDLLGTAVTSQKASLGQVCGSSGTPCPLYKVGKPPAGAGGNDSKDLMKI